MGACCRKLMMSWAGLLVLLMAADAASIAIPERVTSADPPAIQLHQFTLAELTDPSDEAVLSKLRDAVFNIGMFAITDFESNSGSTQTPFAGSLAAFTNCAHEGHLYGQLNEVQLEDMTTRSTLATATNNSVAQELPATVVQSCPAFAKAANSIRKSVDNTGLAYAKVLDRLIHGFASTSSSPAMKGVDSFAAAVNRAESLEHFHLFHRRSGLPWNQAPALELHSDMGLFIVMTAVEYFNQASGARLAPGQGKPDSGFLLELPSGKIVRPLFPDGCLLVMNGEGSTRWMRTAPGAAKPQAPGHEVVVPDMEGVVRAWFGRMYLPPRDALLQPEAGALVTDGDLSSATAPPITFSDYRQQTFSAFHSGQPHKASTLGCSSTRRVLADTGSCGADQVYCWMSCMSVTGLNCSKADMQCIDPRGALWPEAYTNPETGQPGHCFDCTVQCPASSSGSGSGGSGSGGSGASSTEFCNTGLTPITMWMTGFQLAKSPYDPCIAYLFREWPLTSRVKFAFACIGTFLMGIACGGLGYARDKIAAHGRRTRIASSASMDFRGVPLIPTLGKDGAACPGMASTISSPMPRLRGQAFVSRAAEQAILVVLFAAQVTLGYFLMLITMTYQGELFIMVILGLTASHWLFNLLLVTEEENVDPCCV